MVAYIKYFVTIFTSDICLMIFWSSYNDWQWTGIKPTQMFKKTKKQGLRNSNHPLPHIWSEPFRSKLKKKHWEEYLHSVNWISNFPCWLTVQVGGLLEYSIYYIIYTWHENLTLALSLNTLHPSVGGLNVGTNCQ